MNQYYSQSKVTRIKSLATPKPKPKKLSQKAAYALALELMDEVRLDGEVF